jgi:hypothetical protein
MSFGGTMREGDIRIALRDRLGSEHAHDSEDTRIISELGLCNHKVRVDVAVVNGLISGYEIKSDVDTLERLPVQSEWYSRTLDRVCVVVTHKFVTKIEKHIPSWWGILCAVSLDGNVALEEIRDGQDNIEHNPYCVAQFLWREEAIEVLEEYDLCSGLKNKPRHVVWERLAAGLPIDTLRKEVRLKLKSRDDWRVVQPQS